MLTTTEINLQAYREWRIKCPADQVLSAEHWLCREYPDQLNEWEYLTALETWLSTYPFTLAVTINANRELPIHEQERLLRIIDGTLNRLFLGPRYAKRAVGERVGFVAVPEYKVGSVHFHGAILIPNQVRSSVRDKDPKVMVENLLWDLLNEKNRDDKRLLPGASIDVQPYRDTGWIKYMLKNTTRETLPYVNGLPMPEASTMADGTGWTGTSDVPLDVLTGRPGVVLGIR
jgi:hypothetical protein